MFGTLWLHFCYGLILGTMFFNVGMIVGIKSAKRKTQFLLEGWKLIVSLQQKGIEGREKMIAALQDIIEESRKKPE